MTTLDSTSHNQATDSSPNYHFNITTQDLYDREGLIKIDRAFLDFLRVGNEAVYDKLCSARSQSEPLQPKDESALLIEIAPWLEDFIAQLFGIEPEVKALAKKHHELAPLYFCKRQFVQRRAKGKVKADELAGIDGPALEKSLVAEFGEPFSELVFATKVAQWMEDEASHEEQLKMALHYAAQR